MTCFESFDLDHWFLHLLRCSSYGLHRIPKTDTTEVFYINTIAFALLWSYNHLTASTSAILLTRDITEFCNPFWEADVTYRHFVGHLERNKDLIADPCLLVSISCIETLQWMDEYLDADLRTISNIEFDNGHSTWKRAKIDQLGIEELSTMAKAVGGVRSGLFDVVRHVPIVQAMLFHVRDYVPPSTSTVTVLHQIPGGLAEGPLKEALPVLQGWLDHASSLLIYVQNRASNQFPVVRS
jgi:hypothetical protein